MDNSTLSADQKHILCELAEVLMDNARAEAEAVKGYTVQLDLIAKAKSMCGNDPEIVALLDQLAAETEEKTQDELSHGSALFEEFTALTGITPKED